MPKQNNEVENTPDTKTSTYEAPAMSTDQLLTLIVNMQKQMQDLVAATSQNAEKQTAAILELAQPKEPVKTRKQIAEEENEEVFRKQRMEQEQKSKAAEKWAHDNCPHIAGCNSLSEMQDLAQRTSIIWHRGDVGQVTGICTNCQRIFKQSDPDFVVWRKKKSFNKESASGLRTVMDPLKAMEQSYLHDID